MAAVEISILRFFNPEGIRRTLSRASRCDCDTITKMFTLIGDPLPTESSASKAPNNQIQLLIKLLWSIFTVYLKIFSCDRHYYDYNFFL